MNTERLKSDGVGENKLSFVPFDTLNAIEDFVVEFDINVERASCIMRDIADDYFGSPVEKQEKDEWGPAKVGYEEHATKSAIVEDYLRALRKLSDAFRVFFDDEIDKCRKAAGAVAANAARSPERGKV